MTVVLAVDGGNTKTVALVARADGTIIGAGRGGCADVYGAVSVEAAMGAVVAAVGEALADAGIGAPEVSAAVLSLAGADWPEDFAMHGTELPARIGLDVSPLVVNDSIAAIRTGTPDAVGVAVVIGTGGAIGGRDATGRMWHRGFWPDPMGARALGRGALRAVYRADFGLDPPTALAPALFEACGVSDATELLHAWTRRGGIPADRVGDLAPIVLDVAMAGDEIATAIVTRMGTILGEAAAVTAAHLDLKAYTLVLAGGLLRHPGSPLIVEPLVARAPGSRPVRGTREPAVGALLMAFDRLDISPDMARLDASVPHALFETRRGPIA
jgi:N-acetylglucosamine kinase-like BadF-type ATPase